MRSVFKTFFHSFSFLQHLLAFSLCAIILSACTRTSEEISSISYDDAAGTYTVANQFWENLFEWSTSPDGNYLVYVASSLGDEPEAWLYDHAEDTHRQLTNNGYFIESQVQVDNSGNWALVLTEASNSRSKLLYNGQTITDNSHLNRSPCFWGDRLFYAAWDIAAGTTTLFFYDPASGKTEFLASDLPFSTGRSAVVGEVILLEAYDIAEKTNMVLAVHPEAEAQGKIETLSSGDSFLLLSGAKPQILQISGDINAKYLFNAYYWLNRYQSGEPWSGSPDSAGRVSWNQSFRFLGMVELWEKTEDESLRVHISTAVKRLISTREAARQNGGEERDGFLFASKKYSIDQETELRLMVNNAMVYWPMLRAAAAGCLEMETRQALLSMVETAFQYYEEDWDPTSGCYRFRKGDAFWADGVVLPFNQQNAFGLCLIELWKATGKTIYQERCTALARTIEKELKLTEDSRTIWHYWPQEFYNGWAETENISQNTPVQAPMDNPPYEDISHAAINATFILEYFNTFGSVFSQAQVQGLRLTLDAVCTDDGFTTLLEPTNTTGRILESTWAFHAEAGERETAFARCFLATDTYSSIEFDGQIPFAFARLYDPKEGGTLQASTFLYSDGALYPLEKLDFSLKRIPTLAARFHMLPF